MPRPKKIRRIREYPDYVEFVPAITKTEEVVYLTLGEYECICLIDYENLTHQECSNLMDISRTTVTEIYESARKKIADCLINGKKLIIAGGKYRLYSKKEGKCMHKMHGRFLFAEDFESNKEENVCRVAIPVDDSDNVYKYFGNLHKIKLYDLKDGEVIKSKTFDVENMPRGRIIGALIEIGIDAYIGGIMGDGAIANLERAGIKMYLGVEDSADKALKKFVNGDLVSDISSKNVIQCGRCPFTK